MVSLRSSDAPATERSVSIARSTSKVALDFSPQEERLFSQEPEFCLAQYDRSSSVSNPSSDLLTNRPEHHWYFRKWISGRQESFLKAGATLVYRSLLTGVDDRAQLAAALQIPLGVDLYSLAQACR